MTLREKFVEALSGRVRRLKYRLDNFVWSIKHRTFWKYNVIKIHSLEPGYHDTDTRLVHGMFDLLVDFIEIEKASHHRAFNEAAKKLNDRESGLAYLDWEIALEDPVGQAEAAREQKELYLWWKDIYPKRQDPMDESGWSDFCDQRRDKMFIFTEQDDGNFLMSDELTPEEKQEEHRILDLLVEIEKRNEKEDEDMLIRLIKIRQSLWT